MSTQTQTPGPPGEHPEELLDAWRAGQIESQDAARLDAHARACVACRLELEVEPGLDDETGLRAEDESKMAAMIGTALVDLPQASGPGGEAAPVVEAGASKSMLVGIGLAGGIVVALVLAGRADPTPPTPSAQAPVTASASEPGAEGAEVEHGPTPPIPDAAGDATADATGHDASGAEAAPAADEPTPDEGGRAASTPVAVPDAATLLHDANAERRAKRYPQAARLYERLAKHHPGSDEEILARVTYGTMLLDHLDRPADALRRFDAYLSARGAGTLAEEALAGRAKALGRLGRSADEAKAWSQLLERFPDSVYADLARRRSGR